MITTLINPGTLPVADDTISNFDGEIAPNLEAQLRAGYCVEHTAWDHWGLVYFEGGLFKEEVWQYRQVVGVLSDISLSGLITAVNEEYGRE